MRARNIPLRLPSIDSLNIYQPLKFSDADPHSPMSAPRDAAHCSTRQDLRVGSLDSGAAHGRIDKAVAELVDTKANRIRESAKTEMQQPDRDHQKQVNAYFLSTLSDWDAIYHESGVYQTIYQQRRMVALSLIDKLAVPAGSRVLEVGCAHGLTTIALAEREFLVEAVDAVPEMISAARIRAQQSAFVQRVSFQVADIHDLPFPANSFHLVLVIGVAEWLRSLTQPLREIERVLMPEGYLVIASDNQYALVSMLDPLRNPVAVSAKRTLQALLLRFGLGSRHPHTRSYSIRRFDSFLRSAGLRKVEGKTVGFGPLSFCRRRLLPENTGLKVHSALQKVADSGLPFLRSSGYVYIVVAQK